MLQLCIFQPRRIIHNEPGKGKPTWPGSSDGEILVEPNFNLVKLEELVISFASGSPTCLIENVVWLDIVKLLDLYWNMWPLF